jgi:hypothetical protein
LKIKFYFSKIFREKSAVSESPKKNYLQSGTFIARENKLISKFFFFKILIVAENAHLNFKI